MDGCLVFFLVILWVVGVLTVGTSIGVLTLYSLGGLIHILLLIAVVIILLRIIKGERLF